MAVAEMTDIATWDRGFLDFLRSKMREWETTSVNEFSLRLDVSHTTVWKWLEDGRRPSWVTCEKIAGPLGVEADEVLWLAGYNVQRPGSGQTVFTPASPVESKPGAVNFLQEEFEQLTAEQQNEVWDFIRFKRQQQAQKDTPKQ